MILSLPSLYAHFGGIKEIRQHLALRGYRELTARMVASGFGLSGEQALVAVCNAYLEWIRTSPGLYSAIIACPYLQNEELAAAAETWIDVIYRALAFYGFDKAEAIHASRGIRSIVHGFGSLERGGSFSTGVDRDESFRRMLLSVIDGLRKHAGACAPREAKRNPSARDL